MKKSFFILLLSLSLYHCMVFAETQTTTTTTNAPPADITINNNDSELNKPNTTTTTTTTTTTNNSIPTQVDENIISAVYTNYAKAPALIGTSLTVTSLNGIVTIEGTVTAQSQADAAVEEAKSVPGVKDVRSNITVTTNPNLNNPKPLPNY